MRKTRPNHQNPGLIQKSKVPKWVCRSPLASFCNGPPFFAIFGPDRGQIFGKRPKKYQKIDGCLRFFLFGQCLQALCDRTGPAGKVGRTCCRTSSGRLVDIQWTSSAHLVNNLHFTPKKTFFLHFLHIFWPLARPKIWIPGTWEGLKV